MCRARGGLSREDVLSLLQKCGDLIEGRRLHSLRSGVDRDTLLSNRLIQMYGKCGSPDEARLAFDKLEHRNVFSWVLAMAACTQNGRTVEARGFLDRMPQHNEVGLHTMLSAYAQRGHLREAREILEQMPQLNTPSCTVLMAAFVKQGDLENAWGIFPRMPRRDVIAWNALISAFADRGDLRRAIQIFHAMDVLPDSATLYNLVSICSSLGEGAEAKLAAERVEECGFLESMGAAVVNMFAKCGDPDAARSVFNRLAKPNPGSWNALLTALGQAGRIEEARRVFEEMPERTVVSWNAAVSMYAIAGRGREAMALFAAMDLESECRPNAITFTAEMDACTGVGALARARILRDELLELGLGYSGFEFDEMAGVALVKMLARCGSVEEARVAFDAVAAGGAGAAAWNTMIGAYAHNARPLEAMELFAVMVAVGSAPTAATFTSVLAACSHEGSLANARSVFGSMLVDYGVDPSIEHYVCLVDLLGRSGRIAEAEELVASMPFEPDASCWTTLLGGARAHKNLEAGVRAAAAALSLDSKSAPSYVLLSNIYAEACRHGDVARIRRMMHRRGVRKAPGSSWIEVKGKIHEFVAGDDSHTKKVEIYEKLESMEEALAAAGYVRDASVSMHDVGEGEKRKMIGCHSEKLAVAFGLIATPEGTPLRVFKNLRVCVDCHAALKAIASVTQREIAVRDANRFHVFRDGRCSCGDYW